MSSRRLGGLWLWLALIPLAPAAAGPTFVPPLAADGYLWTPPPSPLPESRARFQFGFNHHSQEWSAWGYSNEVTFSSIQFLFSAEYAFLDALTVGLDLPVLMVYDVSDEGGAFEDSGADLGNLRLQLRYSYDVPGTDLLFCPAFRAWLPTNTFLEVEIDVAGYHDTLHLLESLAVFEPMIGLGWASPWLSVLVWTGPKFVVLDDADDFSMWGIDLVLGAAPFASLPGLELVLELNMLIELDDDMIQLEDWDDTAVPLALSLGARYRFSAFEIELALRIGLHQADLYYGDFGLGLTAAYRFGG